MLSAEGFKQTWKLGDNPPASVVAWWGQSDWDIFSKLNGSDISAATTKRVGQSDLNAHGFKINLKENDLCFCQRSETTSHYFLDCFLYQEERKILFEKISEYLPRFRAFSKSKKLEIILSGFNLQNIEPDPRNVPVVFAVQNYILKTKRFSSPPQPTLPLSHHAPSS